MIPKKWVIGDIHEHYGEIVMMRLIEGEPYRFFKDKDGIISMIPLAVLEVKE